MCGISFLPWFQSTIFFFIRDWDIATSNELWGQNVKPPQSISQPFFRRRLKKCILKTNMMVMPQEFSTWSAVIWMVLWFHVSLSVVFQNFTLTIYSYENSEKSAFSLMNRFHEIFFFSSLQDKEGQCWSSCQQNWGRKFIPPLPSTLEFQMYIDELDGGQFETLLGKNSWKWV